MKKVGEDGVQSLVTGLVSDTEEVVRLLSSLEEENASQGMGVYLPRQDETDIQGKMIKLKRVTMGEGVFERKTLNRKIVLRNCLCFYNREFMKVPHFLSLVTVLFQKHSGI